MYRLWESGFVYHWIWVKVLVPHPTRRIIPDLTGESYRKQIYDGIIRGKYRTRILWYSNFWIFQTRIKYRWTFVHRSGNHFLSVANSSAVKPACEISVGMDVCFGAISGSKIKTGALFWFSKDTSDMNPEKLFKFSAFRLFFLSALRELLIFPKSHRFFFKIRQIQGNFFITSPWQTRREISILQETGLMNSE